MKQIVSTNDKHLARPLRVLIPLIKWEISAGDAAGLEHYRKAGEMLLEAKTQVPRGNWAKWVKQNFNRSTNTALGWMNLAKSNARNRFKTLSQARGDIRPPSHRPEWQPRMKQIFDDIKVEKLNTPVTDDAAEEKLERKLALELIDIGYKTLSMKLHPDKGGSKEAMSRLNNVRENLKTCVYDW